MSNGNKLLNLFFSQNIFLGSFNFVEEVRNENLPECCFVGRSNVGKSTIINAITKSKKLAKTSKTPGRTQNINLFKISNKVNIVDLPGYGYAKISKLKRNQLYDLIESYLSERKNLKQIFVLIDCKVGIKDVDIDIFDTISESDKKFSVILTKIDKCALSFIKKQNESLLSLMQNYKSHFNNIHETSSSKNIGITDMQKEIFNLSKI
jgi:GTP-binding protein|tara:strand:- start:224 stop:844 length:621 start_codon:yes stop_codon:yes gene_type:complete